MGGSSSYKGVIRGLVTAVMITHRHHPFTIPKPLSIITPPHTSFTTASLIVRSKPPPLSASMTTTTQTHGDHNLDAIFAQKRVLRSKVKKDLRSMDPTLRSYEAISDKIKEALFYFSADDDSVEYIIQFWAPVMTTIQLRGASPLADAALERGLTHSFMLPVCVLSQTTSSSCIGVLELSMPRGVCYPESIFKTITSGLEDVGLCAFQTQERIPYQIMHGLEPARDKIEQALETIVGSCEASLLAQVWITFEDDNHVPFPSNLEGTQKKQMLSLKLTGYTDGIEPCYDEYYGLCDMFPLEMGEDFVQKTLEYKPRFCNDVSKLSGAMLVKEVFDDFEKGRLAICLRSNHTGDISYAFEFIWGDNRDSDVKLVEELLLQLKELLPGFKLVSGAEFGDKLDFIDVGDSTATETKFLKIFQGKSLALIPGVLEEGRRIAPVEVKCKTTKVSLSREMIERQFGNKETVAAKNLNVSESTLRRACRNFGILKWVGQNKRKVADLYHTNEEDTRTIQEPLPINGSLTIKAEYKGDMIKFRLNVSQATFETVMEEIGRRFTLARGTYKVKYLDEDEDWILLTSEQDMSDCNETSRNPDRAFVRLLVETST